MYGYEVRKAECNLGLFEVFKDGIKLGEVLHVIYDDEREAFYYLTSEVDNLPCEERLYLRTLMNNE